MAQVEAISTAQTEKLACAYILDLAKEFYKNPENQKAFEAWQRRSAPKRKEHALKGEEFRERQGGKAQI